MVLPITVNAFNPFMANLWSSKVLQRELVGECRISMTKDPKSKSERKLMERGGVMIQAGTLYLSMDLAARLFQWLWIKRPTAESLQQKAMTWLHTHHPNIERAQDLHKAVFQTIKAVYEDSPQHPYTKRVIRDQLFYPKRLLEKVAAVREKLTSALSQIGLHNAEEVGQKLVSEILNPYHRMIKYATALCLFVGAVTGAWCSGGALQWVADNWFTKVRPKMRAMLGFPPEKSPTPQPRPVVAMAQPTAKLAGVS